MKLLLDTHVWLWMLADPPRLGDARQRMSAVASLPAVHRDHVDRLLVAQAARWMCHWPPLMPSWVATTSR